MRKDSALCISHFLNVKWLTHLHQGNNEWHLQQLFKKNYRENRRTGYENRIEGSYRGEKFQRERGPDQISDQIRVQVSVSESPNKTQE